MSTTTAGYKSLTDLMLATNISWDSFNPYFICKAQFISLSKASWLKSVPLYVGNSYVPLDISRIF